MAAYTVIPGAPHRRSGWRRSAPLFTAAGARLYGGLSRSEIAELWVPLEPVIPLASLAENFHHRLPRGEGCREQRDPVNQSLGVAPGGPPAKAAALMG